MHAGTEYEGASFKSIRLEVAMLLRKSAVICFLFLAFTNTSLFGQNKPEHSKIPSNSVDRPTLQARDQRYRLEPDDVFDLDFVLTPEFNQTVTVQPDGYISLRGLGDVKVLGQTIPEASATIRAAYANILDNPPIAIVLKDFEKPYFVAGGWIGKPGKYDLRGETTLSQAIQVAGGLRDGAKASQVILFRSVSNNWVEVKKLNVKDILEAKNTSEDIRLRSGDMFLIPKGTFAKIEPFIPRATLGAYFPFSL
jgi:polysaccharide export outer membrane protein